MATFVLVPGAGGMAWYWHRAVPLVRAAGHEPIAVDLPGDDSRAGLAEYADIIIRALAERRDVVLVAQSLAGFTAPLVCARKSVRMDTRSRVTSSDASGTSILVSSSSSGNANRSIMATAFA
jgi:hypothetical protein